MKKNNESNTWFTLEHNRESEKITLTNLLSGPWDCLEHLFMKNEEIYLSKDIFYYKEEEFASLSNSFYQSINEIAATVDDSFISCDPHSIWDLFLIHYESIINYNRNCSIDSAGIPVKEINTNKSNSLGNELVNNMMVMVLNYSGKASADEYVDEKQPQESLLKTKEKTKLFKEQPKDVLHAFKSMKEEQFSNRLQTVNNILKKLESHYFREKFESDEDRIKGTSNLPFTYVVEMIKDINDVLKLYKENLLANVANALYSIKEP